MGEAYRAVPSSTNEYCSLEGNSTIVRLDFTELELELLIESADPFFLGVQWEEPGALKLAEAQGNAWRYDLTTGELAPLP